MSPPDYRSDGPDTARTTLVLAHGAGQGMDSAFMSFIAGNVAEHGIQAGGIRVIRFEFPYMRSMQATGKRRPPDRSEVLMQAWGNVISKFATGDDSRHSLIIGGKSLGGRIASMVADGNGVTGLVCLGYPFHPPGKPDRLRIAHLQSLVTPTLICQGERDTFGNRGEVESYALSAAIGVSWLPDGDHGFKPRKRSGLTSEDNWRQAAKAIVTFVAGLR